MSGPEAPPVERIPGVVFAYHDLGMLRRTLDHLTPLADRLSLTVVENASPNTATEIRPYLLGLLRDGRIDRYIGFRRNITNNALEVVFEDRLVPTGGARCVFLTDGDVVPDNPGWFDEQVGVLDRHPEVAVCAIRLGLDNLPLATFPEAGGWVPPPIAEHDDYIETPQTGVHCWLVRGDDFRAFLRYRRQTGQRFVDGTFGGYVRSAGRKWAVTKRSSARHLVWDLYADLDHPYTRLKLAKSFRRTWYHYRYAACDVWTRAGRRTHVPYRAYFRALIAVARSAAVRAARLVYPFAW